ncbi:MAG TPA: muconolactone Delta-isomerase family protein [Anaerolineaceae bacterium]|nr:muconolactone Delta-isomerase family protein [Anaerolineaceae bacterium]
MKILALEKELPDLTPDAFKSFAEEEAREAWALYQTGIIRELYFHADQQSAVLVLECESVEEARSILASLPFVRERLITFEIIPLKAYPGFARLFHEEEG